MPDHRQHVVRRILAFPICSTAAICIHESETVPHDPIFSGIRTGRFGVWLGSVVCIPVPGIAMHVIECPAFGRFRPIGLFCSPELLIYHVFALKSTTTSSELSARHAYSHSASDGISISFVNSGAGGNRIAGGRTTVTLYRPGRKQRPEPPYPFPFEFSL